MFMFICLIQQWIRTLDRINYSYSSVSYAVSPPQYQNIWHHKYEMELLSEVNSAAGIQIQIERNVLLLQNKLLNVASHSFLQSLQSKD
jgi:hypothetical protein